MQLRSEQRHTLPLRRRVPLQAAGKRALDILVAGIALPLLAPLFALIALLIRIESRGPALFRQERVGQGGQPFTCLKFRTMVVDADPEVHRQAFAQMVAGTAMSDDPATPYKLDRDPRVTRVGQFLRRTSLDELPQLINVLRGEMSLVGPRPAIPYELEHYQTWHHQRHLVKPGITGLWQVQGRGVLGFDEMLALDVQYATRWTLWLDLELLARTARVVLEQRGAR